jgi:DNA-binding MarR family transcriptional regulator
MIRTRARPDDAEWAADATALAHGLTWLSNRLSARAVEAYRPFGLSAVGARVIRVLGETPSVHAAALSARIDIDPAATCRALKSLKERGWVYADEHRRLALTDSGLRLRDEVAALSEEMYRGLTLGFSAADRRQLTTYLMRLRENLPALSVLAGAVDPRARENR